MMGLELMLLAAEVSAQSPERSQGTCRLPLVPMLGKEGI